MNKPLLSKMLLAGTAGLFVVGSNVSADPLPDLIALNPTDPLNITSVPASATGAGSGFTSTGEQGYRFFYDVPVAGGTPSDKISPSTFATINPGAPEILPSAPTGTNVYVGGNYAKLTIANTLDYSGVFYGDGSMASPLTLATISLSGNIPQDFDVGVLTGNSNAGGDPTLYTLSLYSPGYMAGVSVPLESKAFNTTTFPAGGGDYFYYVELNNALSGISLTGDTLVISGTGTGSANAQVTLGGVTLDTLSTPEPSTYALLFAGLGTLMLVARLRRSVN